jgi:stage V sporulation protein B
VPGLGGQLWALLAPIYANQTLTGALRTIENVMVPACLALFTQNRTLALEQYGALKGMALPVLFFPFSFLGTLSTLLLPEITQACVQGKQQTLLYLIRRVMLLTMLPALLAGGLFYTFAYELGEVLYQSREIGFYLAVLGPLAPFMYMESMVDGVMKGINEQLSTFRYSMVDSAVRIALIAVLLPRYGMKGFLFVMLVSNLLTSLLNLHRMLHRTGLRFGWKEWLLKPGFCLVLARLFCRFVLQPLVKERLSALWWLAVGGVGMSLFYALLLWLTGSITRADLPIKNAPAHSVDRGAD